MTRSEKPSIICRPEHTYHCMAVLEAALGNDTAPDPDDFLTPEEQGLKYPLFITWNKYVGTGTTKEPQLRGCIGCFSPLPLEEGLREYALTSALKDTRFQPIKSRELPLLQCGVSLLTPFQPAEHPLDWQIGLHGIHITFHHRGQRYSGTYLPDVVLAQGWNKVEAIQSLCRKAGYRGLVVEGDEVWLGIELKTYTSEKCTRDWKHYVEWKEGKRL